MNPVHLHLLLNHAPVVGIPIAGVLLAWGIAQADRRLQRTAFALLVALALLTLPVFLTGEPAEETVEHLPGVAETMIGRHEDLATFAAAATAALGLIAVAALALSRKGRAVPRPAALAGLVGVIASAAFLTPTAYLGGQIRHTEIRGAAAGAAEDRELDDREAARAVQPDSAIALRGP